jgi:hypothetical protein
MLLAVSERGVDVIQPLFSEHELLLLSGQLLSCRQSNLHNYLLVTEQWRTKNRFPKLLDNFGCMWMRSSRVCELYLAELVVRDIASG